MRRSPLALAVVLLAAYVAAPPAAARWEGGFVTVEFIDGQPSAEPKEDARTEKAKRKEARKAQKKAKREAERARRAAERAGRPSDAY